MKRDAWPTEAGRVGSTAVGGACHESRHAAGHEFALGLPMIPLNGKKPRIVGWRAAEPATTLNMSTAGDAIDRSQASGGQSDE